MTPQPVKMTFGLYPVANGEWCFTEALCTFTLGNQEEKCDIGGGLESLSALLEATVEVAVLNTPTCTFEWDDTDYDVSWRWSFIRKSDQNMEVRVSAGNASMWPKHEVVLSGECKRKEFAKAVLLAAEAAKAVYDATEYKGKLGDFPVKKQEILKSNCLAGGV